MSKTKLKRWLTVLSSILVPGSGYVYLGLPQRGLTMLMWMFAFAFITYHVTPPDLAFLWKISGGLLIWVVSILDVERRSRNRWND